MVDDDDDDFDICWRCALVWEALYTGGNFESFKILLTARLSPDCNVDFKVQA